MIHSFFSTKIALALVTCLLLCFLIFSLTFFSTYKKKTTNQPNESPAKPQGSGGDRQRGFGSAKWWVGWVGTPVVVVWEGHFSPEVEPGGVCLAVVVVFFFEDCRFVAQKVGKTCIFQAIFFDFLCFLKHCWFEFVSSCHGCLC